MGQLTVHVTIPFNADCVQCGKEMKGGGQKKDLFICPDCGFAVKIIMNPPPLPSTGKFKRPSPLA